MPLISEQDQDHIRRKFGALTHPVRLIAFTQELGCQYCGETRQLVEEVAALSDKIEAEVYNFITDKEVAEAYGVDKVPAIAIVGEKDHGVRYYGIPLGYEFSTLIEDIFMVSRGDSGLSPLTRKEVAKINVPIHIQVFVTPSCPYCPRAVYLAHQLAVESDHIRADMVEAMEFPHLAARYSVMSVPRTVINEAIHIEGLVPEPILVRELMKVLELPTPEEAEEAARKAAAEARAAYPY